MLIQNSALTAYLRLVKAKQDLLVCEVVSLIYGVLHKLHKELLMTTNTLQAINDLTNNQLDFFQKLSELNLKTTEALYLKQSELLKGYVDFSSNYASTALKSPFFTQNLQSPTEIVSAWGEKWQGHWRETAELLKTYHDEFKVVAETTFKAAQEGTAQLIEAGQQVATEATEKTKAATAQVIELSQTTASQASEAVKKAAPKL